MVKASSLLLLVSQSGMVGADFQAHDINADLQLAHLSLDADITYSVSDDYFSVDSNGVISSNKRLDADSNNGYYDFLVTMTVPVRIYTKNTNDEEPRFSQQVYTTGVDGNAGPNTLVTSVLAHDKVNNSPSSSS